MGHHEDGGLQVRLGLEKGVDHRPGGAGIQMSGGLVGQQEHGVVDEGAGHGGALLLSAGDLCRILVPDGTDAEDAAQAVGGLLHVASGLPGDDAGQEDVVPDREAVQQQEVLEHEAQFLVAHCGQGVLVQPGQLLAAQADAARVGGDVAGDAVEQGGLTRAGGAHYGHKFPLCHLQGHALEHLIGGLAYLIAFVQILYREHSDPSFLLPA